MAMAAAAAAGTVTECLLSSCHRHQRPRQPSDARMPPSAPHSHRMQWSRASRIRGRARVCMAMQGFAASQPGDPFLAELAAAACTPLGEAQLKRSMSSKDGDAKPPLLDIVSDPAMMAAAEFNPVLMAAPAHVETSYNEHRPRTSRADGETVGMETEGFAIHDSMQLVKNEIHTVGIGAAIGQACMLLAAGTKGKRYMLPHATAMIQQPRMPSMGHMPAVDLQIRAKEVVHNRDTLVNLIAKHTGNSVEKVAKVMRRPYYMSAKKALEFGVVDKILWRGQEAMGETLSPEEWDKRAGIRPIERPMTYGAGVSGLG